MRQKESKDFMGINNLAVSLFKQIRKVNKENIVCSPFGVAAICRILADGANGKTKEELEDIVGLSSEEMSSIISDILKPICVDKRTLTWYEKEQLTKALTIKVANFIAVNKVYPIKPAYISDVQSLYNAKVEGLDFTSDASANYINEWCSKNTNGLVDHIVDKLTNDMLMCALNALYLKGSWVNEFKAFFTHNESFTTENGNKIEVEMMRQEDDFRYSENRVFKRIALPYIPRFCKDGKQEHFAMYVLLPVRGNNIDDIVVFLEEKSISSVVNNTQTTYDVKVKLPKFESESELDLLDMLKKLGVTHLDKDADFKGISELALGLSACKQKTKIKVNESGTEAAAVTFAIPGAGCAPGEIEQSYKTFYADHPFIYMIVNEETHIVYFMGQYTGNESKN